MVGRIGGAAHKDAFLWVDGVGSQLAGHTLH